MPCECYSKPKLRHKLLHLFFIVNCVILMFSENNVTLFLESVTCSLHSVNSSLQSFAVDVNAGSSHLPCIVASILLQLP